MSIATARNGHVEIAYETFGSPSGEGPPEDAQLAGEWVAELAGRSVAELP